MNLLDLGKTIIKTKEFLEMGDRMNGLEQQIHQLKAEIAELKTDYQPKLSCHCCPDEPQLLKYFNDGSSWGYKCRKSGMTYPIKMFQPR